MLSFEIRGSAVKKLGNSRIFVIASEAKQSLGIPNLSLGILDLRCPLNFAVANSKNCYCRRPAAPIKETTQNTNSPIKPKTLPECISRTFLARLLLSF